MSQYVSVELRHAVRQQFQNRCAYCLSQQDISGIQFTIDHIIPESLGGETEVENLCLACWDCNLAKQNRISAVDPETDEPVPLFHPNQQKWTEHFHWDANGLMVVGLTSTGRATIDLLRLNRPILLRARERWIKVGWHPPED